jgi:GntR family transcriptional regulator
MEIERRSGIPLHEQISSWLKEEMAAGRLPPESQLPSEHELCDRFGVSRVTVRRALQTLDADGLIYRRPGLGSFVCDRRMSHGLVRLTDFAQDMGRAGIRATSRVLARGTEPCPELIAERLGLSPGAPVLRLERLRLGNGEPMAVDVTWIPPYYAQLLEGHELVLETIYQVLEREYGIQAVSGRYRISAATADEETARRLEVEPGDALMVLDRTTRTLGQKVLYYQRRFLRADRMAYELEVAREPGAESPEGMPLREFETVFVRPVDRAS